MFGKKAMLRKKTAKPKEEKLQLKEVKPRHKLERKKKIRNKLNNYYNSSKEKINKSLKLQLLTAIAICFIASIIVGILTFEGCKFFGISEHSYQSYDSEKNRMKLNALKISQEIALIENLEIKIDDSSRLNVLIETLNLYNPLSIQNQGPKKNAKVKDLSTLNNLVADILCNYTTTFYDYSLKQIIYKSTNNTNNIKKLTENLLNLKSQGSLTKDNVNTVFYNLITSNISLSELKTQVLQKNINALDGKVYFADNKGNIIFKNNDDFIEQININGALESSLSNDSNADFFLMYPTIFNGNVHYLINIATLSGYKVVYYSASIYFFSILVAIGSFILLLFKLIKRKLGYIEYISKSLKEISTGNLDYNVDIIGTDELSQVAENINYMELELKTNIAKENSAQKTKNELITNVSHDLRTPLTLIIGYLGLVKDKNFTNEEEMETYLNIAYSRSQNLKSLIDDLFEFTKLSNSGIQLHKSIISINNLLVQLTDELLPIANENNMEIISNIPKDRIELQCDVHKITRVFENLIGNAIKYNNENSPIEVNLENNENNVIISISNKCTDIKSEELPKLFDRFYRAEESRNSSTGGSGLGLAISKTIVELHGGSVWAELNNNIISFKVSLIK